MSGGDGVIRKSRAGLAAAGLLGLGLSGCAGIGPGGPAPTATYGALSPGSSSPSAPVQLVAGPPPWSPVGLPTDERGRVRAYNRPYQIKGEWYSPSAQPGYDEVGLASWYGYESGQTTANGEAFLTDLAATAAHKTLPLPSRVEITNLENGHSLVVRLNDRGPFVAGRLIDVSREAARQLGFLEKGTARVRVRYLGPAPIDRSLQAMQLARVSSYRQLVATPARASAATSPPVVKDPLELVAGLP